MSLDLGILVTGSPPADLAARFPGYDTMIAAMLQARDPAVRCTGYDVREDHYPPAIDAHDGYLITGSKHAAYETLPWIERLSAYIRELDARRKPLVGICFGHQLIAQALGGRVEKAAQGWGVGVHRAQLDAPAPWIDQPAGDYALVVSHQDQVQQLPPGAQRIAGSAFCPIAMYRVGNHVFALQAHPEFSRDYSRALMELRSGLLEPGRLDAGMRSLADDIDSARVADWILAFFRQSGG